MRGYTAGNTERFKSLNNYGLIEIYETVLRRGRMLSIESGYNYGPANDALLLAAGYLNDLYMMVGGEAWADAANPTIGIGTAHSTYGDIATALFAFKGQVPSLLEEELALLRGRDDSLLPGVQTAPVYNRMVWNYTRGIDAGEVIYALNYNIQENPNQSPDGVINAADAAVMFPQGHGDAYGHYLTALKGLLLAAGQLQVRLGAAHRGCQRARPAGVGGLSRRAQVRRRRRGHRPRGPAGV